MTGGQIIIENLAGFVRKILSVKFSENGGMGIGEQDPAPGILTVAQGGDPAGQQRLCAGTDSIIAMLTVTGQGAVYKGNPAEGRGGQRDEPVMHKQILCDSVCRNKLPQSGIHDQGASGHVVLHQQLRQRDGGRIPSLMTEEAVANLFAGFIDQGTVGMNQQGSVSPVLRFQILDGLLQYSNFVLFPEIILVTEQDIIRVGLTEQGKEISGGAQMTALFIAENKTAVPF